MGEKVCSSQVCIRWVEKYDEYSIKEHNIIIYSVYALPGYQSEVYYADIWL